LLLRRARGRSCSGSVGGGSRRPSSLQPCPLSPPPRPHQSLPSWPCSCSPKNYEGHLICQKVSNEN
jgi:hypothetical protein